MYLHLGQDMIVPKGEVIAIFDLDTASAQPRTRDFLRRAEKERRLIPIGEDLPKSVVLCAGPFGDVAYLSPISSSTLRKRFLSHKFGW